MKKTIKEAAALVVCLALLLVITGAAAEFYMPERTQYGANWDKYLLEDEDSVDILFLGSSHAYCNVVPAVIYDGTELTSYLVSGPELTLPVTYYYLKQALKTQSPKMVFLEASGLFFTRYMNYTKVNIGYMPYGTNRLCAALFAAESEQRMGLLFPLYNYHDRWAQFKLADYFSCGKDETPDPLAGYTFIAESVPQKKRAERDIDLGSTDFETNLRYLEKIKTLCEKNDATLALFAAPACKYFSDDIKAELIDTAAELGIELKDFNDDFDTLGIDIQTDFYDQLHLNAVGAEKFSNIFAEYIDSCYGDLPRHEHDGKLWAYRSEYYAGLLAEME